MPQLRNPLHEAFAQDLATQALSGQRNLTLAAARAGYKAKGHALEVSASRTLSRAEVTARVAELRAQALQGQTINREWIVAQTAYEALFGSQRVSALRLLAEIDGLVGNLLRLEHSGPNGGAIPLIAGVANLSEQQLHDLGRLLIEQNAPA